MCQLVSYWVRRCESLLVSERIVNVSVSELLNEAVCESMGQGANQWVGECVKDWLRE